MNDIADAVGLTKAGIYHYIRGKEDLLFQIMTFAMDIVDTEVIAHARQVPDAEQRLRTIVERHARRILDVGGSVTIILEEMSGLTPTHRRIIKKRKRLYFELLRETLLELDAVGRLRDVSPTVAAFSLLGMILWISRWYRRDGKLTAEQVLSDFLKVALNAVVKSGSDSSSAELTTKAVLVGTAVF